MLLREPSTITLDIEDLGGISRGGHLIAANCRLVHAGAGGRLATCSETVLSKDGPSRQVRPDIAASSGRYHDHKDISSSGDAADCDDDDDDEEVKVIPLITTSPTCVSMLGDAPTLIILDWDDTILPTSFLWSHQEFRWDRPAPPETLQSLQKHTLAVEALLRYAIELGKVCIVTLARDAWVSKSIDHFMPGLQGLLDELDIDVVYARSALSKKVVRGMIADELRDAGQALKTAAMRQVIRHGTWTSVISIGDSDAEFYSIQDAIFLNKRMETCACKAVKLADKPELETLTIEMEVLFRWLPSIVDHSGDLELDFGEML